MKALVLMTAALGVTLLVFWFAKEQMSSRVPPTPPLVAQLERLVEEGVLGGESPESMVATLVLAGPFRESEPWDTAPRRRSTMNAWFGEPRQYAFMEALLREPRTAGWRTDAAGPTELAGAEEQAASAARWAAERGVRLRVIAHGPMMGPVLRAALASPPDSQVFERVLGVGLSLADLKAKDPVLAQALAETPAPVGQWFDIYSDPAVVPRVLVLERVGPGPAATAEPLAWPGSSWVSTVVQVSERGAPRREQALPTAAPGSQLSARQFRSVKDGKLTQRVVDGKGNFVTGSLIVPKLEKEEVPPDPEAGEKKEREGSARDNSVIAVGDSGWSFGNAGVFRLTAMTCGGGTDSFRYGGTNSYVLYGDSHSSIRLACFPAADPNFPGYCSKKGGTMLRISHHGHPAMLCKGTHINPPRDEDILVIRALKRQVAIMYEYDAGFREGGLGMYQKAIESLTPDSAK